MQADHLLPPDFDAPSGARQLTRDYGDPAARDRDIAAMGQHGWYVQTIASEPGRLDGRRLAIVLLIGLVVTLIMANAYLFLGFIAFVATAIAAIVVSRGRPRTLVLYARDGS